MDRKLASIQKIVDIQPIPDAQNIEKSTILGWEVVTAKKDNFKVGDLVVYFEVDSIVPERPEFEFLRERKFRIKTIRLKKQISQGLVMPLSILPNKRWQEGDDVTSILSVKKHDPMADIEAKMLEEQEQRSKNKLKKYFMKYSLFRRLLFMITGKRTGFPSFIKKTDEDRIQLFPDICEREKDTIFSCTEKVDGQSATFYLIKNSHRFLWFGDKYIFGVCSRRLALNRPDNSNWWRIARQIDAKTVLTRLIGDNQYVVLQGEILGEGIQKNKYKLTGLDFYAFNLIFPNQNLNTELMRSVLQVHNIKTVPILDSNFKLKPSIPEMVDYAKGKSVVENIKREGVVIRNYQKNISFKVVNPEFLLEYGE